MGWIASQPYIKVVREIQGLEQVNIEEPRMIYLYEDRIVTEHREFPFHTMFDMSFRQLVGDEGMLYFHTSKGVYSYLIKTDPTEFIQCFKALEKKKREEQES
ncbi:hypothetical protein LGQ02_05520 [Bacillus shivajii]|uniref:hypothetical protein n=1 Tax=Bacillus shivajii TaxID=1983719 RepID=UPI001CFA83A4|nr:hypothetical protein [Bacillus shivajii]UCZ54221.1 hypothetical protein LGQ02_05520 [Bacillus shivajii]